MKTWKVIGQWALFCLLSVVGFVAFVFVIGEDNPEAPMSFMQFLFMKAGAFAVLFALVYLGKACAKRGWLPDLEKHFGNGYARTNK